MQGKQRLMRKLLIIQGIAIPNMVFLGLIAVVMVSHTQGIPIKDIQHQNLAPWFLGFTLGSAFIGALAIIHEFAETEGLIPRRGTSSST